VAAVGGASGTRLYVNDVMVAASSTPYLAGTFHAYEMLGLRGLAITGAPALGFMFPGKIAYLGLWERALDAAEVAAAYETARTAITAQGEVISDLKCVMIAEGDSITFGTGSPGYLAGFAMQSGRLFPRRLQGINLAVVSTTIETLNARKAAYKAKIAEVLATGKTAICPVLIGTNSVKGAIAADPATAYQAVEDYLLEIRAIGAKVIAQTVIDLQSADSTQRAALATYNQLIRDGHAAGKYDGLADHASTAMGVWSATYMSDDAHPNAAGHALMADTLKAAIAPLYSY
jgi:lysophospholipase L1-like esterase